MPLEREMSPDRPETREKFLCTFRVAKAAHATRAFACRLVAVLCAVVQSGCNFDEHVFHVRKFWDLGFCRRISVRVLLDGCPATCSCLTPAPELADGVVCPLVEICSFPRS